VAWPIISVVVDPAAGVAAALWAQAPSSIAAMTNKQIVIVIGVFLINLLLVLNDGS
jgi:hypothetical protein